MQNDQVLQIVKFLGIEYLNLDTNTIIKEIDNKIESLKIWMFPTKETPIDEDFIIPKEIINMYVGLIKLKDGLNIVVINEYI